MTDLVKATKDMFPPAPEDESFGDWLVADHRGLRLSILVADLRGGLDLPILRASCNVAVFSPPYKKSDGYSNELMSAVGELVKHALVPGSWCFMNFAQLRESFSRSSCAQQLLCHSGLVHHQRIAWVKSYSPGPGQPCVGHVQPLNSASLLNYGFEDLWTSYAPTADGLEPELDRLAIGVPFADKTNLGRGTRGKNGDLRCGGDVWVVGYETTGATKKKGHEYEYPLELVERCLKVSGAAKRSMFPVVFAPFLGGGSTALAAKKLGFSCVAVEFDRKKAEAALERWKSA